MPRTILIAYDHSDASNKALNWVLDHQILLPEDKIYITTVLNDDVLSFEGFGLESAAIGPATWVNDDCGERIMQLKEDSHRLLDNVMQVLKRRGVSMPLVHGFFVRRSNLSLVIRHNEYTPWRCR